MKNLLFSVIVGTITLVMSCDPRCPDEDTDDLNGQWNYVGPRVGGRTTALMFDPADPTHKAIYAGSPGGGLWYNVDIENETSPWTSITTDPLSSVVSCLSYNPQNTDEIYFGTGVYYMLDLGKPLEGNGVVKKTSSGMSILQGTRDSDDFKFVNAIRIHPTSGDIYVATQTGIHRSEDGGNTFSVVLSAPITDIELLDDGSLLAVNGKFYSPGNNLVNFKIWKSVSGDAGTWEEKFTPACLDSDCRKSLRSLLSYQNGVLYAVRTGGSYMYLNKSMNDGETWVSYEILASPNLGGATAGPADRLSLVIDPVLTDHVYVGATAVFRVQTNGVNSTRQLDIPFSVNAVDFHAMDVVQYESGGFAFVRLVLGSDQGIYRITRDANGLFYEDERNMEYYTPLVLDIDHSTDRKNFTAAVWDLSGYHMNKGGYTVALPGPSSGNIGGESNRVYYDTDSKIKIIGGYTGSQYNIFDGSTKIYETSLSKYGAFAPAINTHYGIAENKIQVTVFADDYLSDVKTEHEFAQIEGYFTAIKTSLNSDHLFAGTSEGEVYRIENINGVSPALIALHSPNVWNGRIQDISIGTDDGNVAILLLDDRQQIWHKENNSASWEDVTVNLPDIPVLTILHNRASPEYLMAGTYQGLWQGGLLNSYPSFTWSRIGDGLPSGPVVDLKFQECSNMVIAGVFGRGLYYRRFD